MLSEIEQYFTPGDQIPKTRLYLRAGSKYFRMLDIQLKSKTDHNNLHEIINSKKYKQGKTKYFPNEEASLYIKTPSDGTYITNRLGKVLTLTPGIANISTIPIGLVGKNIFNPYISWHGSKKGEISFKGFNDLDSNKQKRSEYAYSVIPAVSAKEIEGTKKYWLASVILPANSLSYYEDTTGSYINKTHNLLNIDTARSFKGSITVQQPTDIILDRAFLSTESIGIDIYVHHGNSFPEQDLDKEFVNKLIYKPITLEPLENKGPTHCSLIVYSLDSKTINELKPKPIIFTGISRKSHKLFTYEVIKLENMNH